MMDSSQRFLQERLAAPRLQHGGRLRAAAHEYRIPLKHWLDLSTGINPNGWPVPPIPADVWQRLPEEDDGLPMAMQAFFAGTPSLAVAGSQVAIQTLPRLRAPCRVGILSPTYAEHAHSWLSGGHHVTLLTAREVASSLVNLDVLVVVNPNNPTGELIPADTLCAWHAALAPRGGWLVVDEAFADAAPEQSVAGLAAVEGWIVLRSLGKFWGLAGVRAGFVLAHPAIIETLKDQIGPWPLSHPARWVAQRALADRTWQHQTRNTLREHSERLAKMLAQCGLHSPGGTPLFRWVPTAQASNLFEAFAKRAILLRAFDKGLRIGLPGDDAAWERFEIALREVTG